METPPSPQSRPGKGPLPAESGVCRPKLNTPANPRTKQVIRGQFGTSRDVPRGEFDGLRDPTDIAAATSSAQFSFRRSTCAREPLSPTVLASAGPPLLGFQPKSSYNMTYRNK